MFGRIQFATRATVLLLVVVALVVSACGSSEMGGTRTDTLATDSASAARGAPAAGGMANMPGMGQMASGRMMADAEAHMRAMRGAGADSLRRALPAHRQMVANMISQMNREMGDMNMGADAAWTALIDSVRSDLTRMPELSAEELARTMPDHEGRVGRLMTAHRGMMASMSR